MPLLRTVYTLCALAFIACAFMVPAPLARAQGSSDYLRQPQLQVEIPDLTFSDAVVGDNITSSRWIGEYIAAIYRYAIGVVGIIAAAVIMGAGVMWLLAGGNAGRVQEAKEWIKAAVTGLVLALTSYTILYVVNPQLTTFNPLRFDSIQFSSAAHSAALAEVTKEKGLAETVANVDYNIGDVPDIGWRETYGGLDSVEDIQNFIKGSEALRTESYPDEGFYSIGYGHYLKGDMSEARARNLSITAEQAEELFIQDYNEAVADAQRVASEHGVNWDNLSSPRQAVLIDMAYNMGGGNKAARTGLSGFENTLRNVKNENWEGVYEGIMNSDYAINDVPNRARRNATIMLQGD